MNTNAQKNKLSLLPTDHIYKNPDGYNHAELKQIKSNDQYQCK